MEYILIENDIVKEHISTTIHKEAPYIEVSVNWQGKRGLPISYLDSDFNPKPLNQLIDDGVITDLRGIWYTASKDEIPIKKIGEIPPEGSVREKWNHITDELKRGKWISNKKARVDFEKDIIRKKRKSEFRLFDHFQLPLLWSELSEEQQTEYKKWRQAWKDAPEKGVIPERPSWFKK